MGIWLGQKEPEKEEKEDLEQAFLSCWAANLSKQAVTFSLIPVRLFLKLSCAADPFY